MEDEERYMGMALELARQGEGWTSPNPLVGAVLVNQEGVVASGYHRRVGAPHAEIEALRKAGEKAAGCTLYVNLEPCCHYGKTAPCTEALVRAKIKEVVIAMIDPNPQVSGQGVKKLQEAGIKVKTGVLEDQARRLNEAFIKYVAEGRPFVSVKTATTLDGKIATRRGDTRWITGKESRWEVHRLRHRMDGIITGIETVLRDDPALTTRLEGGRDAARVVVDTRARLPLEAQLVNLASPAPTILAAGEKAPREKVLRLQEKGVEVLFIPEEEGRVSLLHLLKELGNKEMIEVMVESGGTLNYAFLEKGLVEKVYAFIAPLICGGKEALTSFEGEGVNQLGESWRLKEQVINCCGDDLLITGYPLKHLQE